MWRRLIAGFIVGQVLLTACDQKGSAPTFNAIGRIDCNLNWHSSIGCPIRQVERKGDEYQVVCNTDGHVYRVPADKCVVELQ